MVLTFFDTSSKEVSDNSPIGPTKLSLPSLSEEDGQIVYIGQRINNRPLSPVITVIPLGGKNLAEAQETTAIIIEAKEADQTPGCQLRKRPLNGDGSPNKELSGKEPGKKRFNRGKAGGGRPTFQTEITPVPCSQQTYQPIGSRSEQEILFDIQDTEEKKKHLLNNELRFAKIISNSPIGKERIEKVRKNWKKESDISKI